MNLFLKTHYDKVLLGLAALGVAASFGWMAQRQGEVRRLRALPVAVKIAEVAYESVAARVPERQIVAWSVPAPQSQGWLFDVFTPPLISFDAKTNAFTVTSPTGGVEKPPVGFDLELVAVQQEPFRLQLVGYYGEAGDYAAAFTSPCLPDTPLARAGHRFAKLGLTLRKVSVTKVAVKHTDHPWPVFEVAAFAELLDEESGTEIVLDSRTPRLTEKLLAVFRLQGGGTTCTRREGETFGDGPATYRIERIQLGPPEVVVTRLAHDSLPSETRKLCPPKDVAGAAPSQTSQTEPALPETAHH